MASVRQAPFQLGVQETDLIRILVRSFVAHLSNPPMDSPRYKPDGWACQCEFLIIMPSPPGLNGYRRESLGRRRGRLAGSRWAGGRRAEADRAVVTGCERARRR